MIKPRPCGTETEFGIISPLNPDANPIVLSTQIVEAYAREWERRQGRAAIGWDYGGEDPLADLRGFHLPRAAAHPSQLTDDPDILAPSGSGSDSERWSITIGEPAPMRGAANVVINNGARFYVDHAHPEYSGPETIDAWQGALYDRAGEEVARQAMSALPADTPIALFKNNQDGKGAAYGSHENYLVERKTDFADLVYYLTPFFVSRQIICGAGRLGRGQRSEMPGFQISQRADFVENTVGLETTFNRPIINTRDEPHANRHRYRRLHVIGGDANQFDISLLLKLGTTSLVLDLIEQGKTASLEYLALEDPVAATWQISHDPTLQELLPLAGGDALTAVGIQRRYLQAVVDNSADLRLHDTDRRVLREWEAVLDKLDQDVASAAGEVEWVAKYELLKAMAKRQNLAWDDPKLLAIDLQWADLRPGRSLAAKLAESGRVRQLFSQEEIACAAQEAPAQTRAAWRGEAVAKLEGLHSASWSSLVIAGEDGTWRRELAPEVIGPRE